jgi:hypothetical protein
MVRTDHAERAPHAEMMAPGPKWPESPAERTIHEANGLRPARPAIQQRFTLPP